MRQIWPVVAIFLLLSFGVWLFLTFYESYEEEIALGFDGEARSNPFLAARYFLELNDVEVVTDASSLDFESLATDELVFLSSVDNVILTTEQIGEALGWIHAGGYLMVGVGQEIEGHESLLNRFDITPEVVVNPDDPFSSLFDDGDETKTTSQRLRELNERVRQRRQEQEERAENDEAADEMIETIEDLFGINLTRTTYELSLSEIDERLELQVLDSIALQHPWLGSDENYEEGYEEGYEEDYEQDYGLDGPGFEPLIDYTMSAHAGDELGTRLMQFEYGDGIFTVFSSDAMWRNTDIGEADHAFFLAYMAPPGSVLKIYFDLNSPSLMKLLRTYFWEALLAAGCLLLLWLWRSSLRVTGIKTVKTGERRLFSEHLLAASRFLVAHRQYQELLTPLHEEITQLMQPHYPGFALLEATAQAELVVQRSSLPTQMIDQWYAALQQCDNENEFETALRLGKSIREKL